MSISTWLEHKKNCGIREQVIALEHKASVAGQKVRELYAEIREKEEEITALSRPVGVLSVTPSDYIPFIQELSSHTGESESKLPFLIGSPKILG